MISKAIDQDCVGRLKKGEFDPPGRRVGTTWVFFLALPRFSVAPSDTR
jgi:hypothetical protein